MIQISPSRNIDENEISIEYFKASGPGGQNINKVSTAVRLRIHIQSTPSLSFEEKQRLIRLAGNRFTDDGFLIIEAKTYRTQEKNRLDAFQRLIHIFKAAIIIPKTRIKTKPSRKAKATRKLEKKK
ncbi:MAG: alternative ribosome rescue aminoacyl-tRNA hydrolase ArfB [Chloroflexota bacterium]